MPAEKPLAVDFTKEDAHVLVFPSPPILSSQKGRWDGIVVEYHRQPAHETPEHCSAQHIISIHVSRKVTVEKRVENGRLEREHIVPGDVSIYPASVHQTVRWDKEGEFIHLYLEPALVARAAYELVNVDRVELLPLIRTRDPLIQQIGLALKAELELDELGSRLYVESLTNALSAHLIRHYSASKQKISSYSGGFQHKLRWAIEYINENLDKNLTLSEIAATLGMSPYHFARAFKQLTGLPPHQYLVERRLEQAKTLLAKTDLAIAEIAYRVGFANQSHFTTLFRKHTAITPKAYRNAL